MILKAQKVIIGDGITVINNGAVMIKDGKIFAVGVADAIEKAYPQCELMDYGDASILPGLIDMHVHIGNVQTQPDAALYNDKLKALMSAYMLKIALEKGVTTIRDVGSEEGMCATLKTAAQKGFIEIPQLLTTIRGISMTGGHCWELDSTFVADSPWGVRKAIRTNIQNGADWIKIMTSHRSFTPEYTMEELIAAVDECHRVNKKICAHASNPPSIGMCIEAGFDTIEHATYLTVEQAKLMKEKGIAWVPTLSAYTYINEFHEKIAKEMMVDIDMICPERIDELFQLLRSTRPDFDLSVFDTERVRTFGYFKKAADQYISNFKQLAETGVVILAGTDMVLDRAPVTPVNLELEYMVQYGLSNLDAVKAATSAPAKVLGLNHQIGLLLEGLHADIAIFKGDVETDITALKTCVGVFQNGKRII
ncbi:MAG: amidohydrolase family protein [Eubacteriales bacterium]|jgi:imidazolonepropionase-like amidohydrolase|nr:amidohydrolase family protein [Eubacteriales bacterium]